MDTLAFTSCIFEEDEEAEEKEVSVPLLGQPSSSTAITQEEEVNYMDNNTVANDDSRPRKVSDEDQFCVEIPQTAHQISKGNSFIFLESLFFFGILLVCGKWGYCFFLFLFYYLMLCKTPKCLHDWVLLIVFCVKWNGSIWLCKF